MDFSDNLQANNKGMYMENIGFIGLGIMGAPMAENLLKAKVPLLANDLNPDAVNKISAKGARAATLRDIAGNCGIVFTILPDGKTTQQVLFDDGGLAGSLKPGTLIVDMSSVTPEESRICANGLESLGCSFIDAPVSGGEPKAIDGTLVFMVGGKQNDFERAKPFFQIMGNDAVLVGSVGSGSLAKLANQVIVNLTIAAVSEALVMVAKAGGDPEKVFKAIRGGLAASAVLEAKVPMMLERNFKPGGTLTINRKDIGNALATAHKIESPMPLSSQLYEIMQSLSVMGLIENDHSSIVQYFETLSGTKVH